MDQYKNNHSNIFSQITTQMGKQEQKDKSYDAKSNKVHKTLRQKLIKKREELKQHKKEKREQKKMYNAQEEKLKFFSQNQIGQQGGRQLKLKRITKYIQKFIDIYEDNLDDFYDMFKTFDEGGQIDISGLENKSLYKCLKKMFKYLPLKKEKGEYKKMQTSKINLQKFIKNKISQSIQYYLQNGSKQAQSNDESSAQQNQQITKKSKKSVKVNSTIKQQQDAPIQPLRLYKEVAPKATVSNLGPSISFEDKERLAQAFQRQIQQMKNQKIKQVQKEENQFDMIFNMGKTRAEMKGKQLKTINQGVPQHLLAAGSALIGQKVDIDEQEMEQYNRIHRPKKLIDIHKQLKQNVTQQDPKKRKPFNRERDILGQGKTDFMSNSTFFDFKTKMSKPTKTNQFL